MSYAIEAGAVRWSGRKIRGASAGSFRALGGRLGIDADHVYLAGRPQKADAASFELLSAGYGRDAERAYLVMETKLKPIPGADAASFEALGQYYARDKAKAYFQASRLRLKKGAGSLDNLREIGAPFATDGAWLYFAGSQLEPPATGDAPFDFTQATLRAFDFNTINMPDALLTDGACTYYRSWTLPWTDVTGIDAAAAERLGDGVAGLGNRHYLWDGQRLYFEGDEVSAARGHTPRLIGSGAVEAGGVLYSGAEAVRDVDPSELRWIAGGTYSAPAGLVLLDTISGEATHHPRAACLTLEEAIRALLDRLVPVVASLADRYLPVECSPQDFDYDQPAPAGVPDFELVSADAGRTILRAGGRSIEAPTAALLTQASSIWAASRGAQDRLRVWIGYGTMLPKNDPLHEQLAKRFPLEFLDMAGALHAAGDPGNAMLIAHLVLGRALRFGAPETEHYAHLAHGLAGAGRHTPSWHNIEKTTNFGVVKLLSAPGVLVSDDPRSRHDLASTLTAAAIECNKKDRAVPLATQAILQRLDAEPLAFLRETLLGSLDMCCTAATLAADMGQAWPYPDLELAARRMIDEGANVDLGRVRLIEALYGQNRAEEAAAVEAGRPVDDPSGDQLPGPYVHRQRFHSFGAAALAARVRALPALARIRGEDQLPDRIEQLRRDLRGLRSAAASAGRGADRPDLDHIESELADRAGN